MMFADMNKQLVEWNNSKSDRQKLQLVYLFVIVLSFVVAAIIGLINQNLGFTVLKITVVAILTFSMNAIAWALLNTFLLDKLKPTVQPRQRTNSRKR